MTGLSSGWDWQKFNGNTDAYGTKCGIAKGEVDGLTRKDIDRIGSGKTTLTPQPWPAPSPEPTPTPTPGPSPSPPPWPLPTPPPWSLPTPSPEQSPTPVPPKGDPDTKPKDDPEVKPLHWNKMSQQEKYEYMKELVIDQAGKDPNAKYLKGNGWKSKDGAWNIIGVRGFQDGQVNKNKPDRYNDTIFLVRMKDGKPEVREFDASVDAGKWSKKDAVEEGYGYYKDGENQGIVHLADGFYQDAWMQGHVPRATDPDLGLRQRPNSHIRVNVDSNFDGKIQENERMGKDKNGDGRKDGLEQGYSGIHFHRGRDNRVGHHSAGCQVVRDKRYEEFVKLVYDTKQSSYSYLLIDGDDLPGAH